LPEYGNRAQAQLPSLPLYVGLVLLYTGLACMLAVVWAPPLLIPAILYIKCRAIMPEERYLGRAFGDV